jgi:nucleotide-binding universal stress UspA family protein
MIKNVILNLATGVRSDATVPYAVSLARAFEAHLAAVAFAYDPVPIAMVADDVPPEWIDEMRREADAAAKTAIVAFEEAAWRGGISAEAQRSTATLAGTAELFGRMARRFDLSIIGQAEPDKGGPAPLIIQAALFDSGRPMLLVPYIQKADFTLDRAMVCWDGSRSAARAVGDAMPFLERAKTAQVVVVTERGKDDEIPGAQIATHLARHGVTVEIKQIVAPDGNVADVLLSHAADQAADFMVLGAYGHSRLREFILGGVTRSVLEGMTIPVLMSH